MLDLFPEGQAAQVASYYRAYCLQAKGNVTGGRTLLSKVIGGISSHFKPRAILALATSFFDAGEYAACREIYFEAARAAVGADPLTESQAIRGTAIIAAIDGNHEQSLSILTNLVPVMRFLGDSYPADLYDHFNSIAIELGELGRVEEANRLIDQVLCSPFAKNSPHWLDTKLELASKPRRVFAPFVMALGAIEPTEEPFTAELSPRSKKSAARNKAAHIPLKAMLLRSVIARVPTQGEPITAHSKHTHQTLSGYSPSRPIRGPPPLSTLAYAQLIMAIGSN
ncbi:MAG: tetratricopeptide repeat protein [Blastocatellia bacterium]